MCFCFSSINVEKEHEAERRCWQAETDLAVMFDQKRLNSHVHQHLNIRIVMVTVCVCLLEDINHNIEEMSQLCADI